MDEQQYKRFIRIFEAIHFELASIREILQDRGDTPKEEGNILDRVIDANTLDDPPRGR